MKFIKIFIFYIIVSIKLFSFELEMTQEVFLEKLNYINYEQLERDTKIGFTYLFSYNQKNSLFFIALQNKNIKSSSQKISNTNNDNYAISLEVFNENGKHIGSVGKMNSFENGGIINIDYMQTENDTIFIYDSETKRINAFELRDSKFPFLYSIDLKKNQNSYSFHIKNNKLFGSKPKDFLISHYNTASMADIIPCENYPKSKEITDTKTFFSCEKYREVIDFYNNKIFKKLNIEKITDLNLKIIYECIFTGGIYTTVLYAFNNDNTFYGINVFGTELIKFDISCNPIDTIKINEFEDFRKYELDLYKKIHRKNVSFTNVFSKLENIFLNKKDGLVFLYYRLTPTMSEKKNGNKFLFVYSIPERKFIANFYPINFIPIDYDENINRLIGFNYTGDNPCIEYYKITQ